MNDSEATFLPAVATIKPAINIPSKTILASASSTTTISTDRLQVDAPTTDCHVASTSASSTSGNCNWPGNHNHLIYQQRPCEMLSHGEIPPITTHRTSPKCGNSGQAVEVERRRAIDKSSTLLHHGSTGSTIFSTGSSTISSSSSGSCDNAPTTSSCSSATTMAAGTTPYDDATTMVMTSVLPQQQSAIASANTCSDRLSTEDRGGYAVSDENNCAASSTSLFSSSAAAAYNGSMQLTFLGRDIPTTTRSVSPTSAASSALPSTAYVTAAAGGVVAPIASTFAAAAATSALVPAPGTPATDKSLPPRFESTRRRRIISPLLTASSSPQPTPPAPVPSTSAATSPLLHRYNDKRLETSPADDGGAIGLAAGMAAGAAMAAALAVPSTSTASAPSFADGGPMTRNGSRNKEFAPTWTASTSSALSAQSTSSLQSAVAAQKPPPPSSSQTVHQPLTSLSNSVFAACGTSCSQIICTPLRTMVSQNRRRYQQDGFNLDLTYITDRIIAMGYPADTTEALYRNSMSHIVKFLEHYHPGHYKVFNLRGQYVYDTSRFHNRVVSFEMTDHHPPRLELMAPFCREVHEYLEADPRNVVAVHCKAGKGRTGVMICAYLCYISFYRTPRQNMDYYSIVRTHNNKGVTIPSQRRYVYYFAHLRQKRLNYMPLRTELVGIYVEKPPKLSGPLMKGALKIRVTNGDVDVFLGDDLWLSADQSEEEEEMHRKFLITSGDDQYDPYATATSPSTTSATQSAQQNNCISRRCYGWTVPANQRVFLEGDVRISIFQKSQLKVLNVKQEKKKIGHIWFNTMFCCAGFCGGQYVHGDEAYPYPDSGESMIVRRRLRRRRDAPQSTITAIEAAKLAADSISGGGGVDNDLLVTRRRNSSNAMDGVGAARQTRTSVKNPCGDNCGASPCASQAHLHHRCFNDVMATAIKKESNVSQFSAPLISYSSKMEPSEPLLDDAETAAVAVDDAATTTTTTTDETASSASSSTTHQKLSQKIYHHGIERGSNNSSTSSATTSSSTSSDSSQALPRRWPSSGMNGSTCQATERQLQKNFQQKSSTSSQNRTAKIALRLNGISKRRRSPVNVLEAEHKCWMSQDGDVTTTGVGASSGGSNSSSKFRDGANGGKCCRSSLGNNNSNSNDNEYEEEIVVDEPPGLESHCPRASLKDIYQSEKQAPRYGIKNILHDAYRKNLIHDLYNTRRMSIPRVGAEMPKAPVGRPNADSRPMCVMRRADEHVTIYNVQEIDKAHKSKDLDMMFKVYVVTRCLRQGNADDTRLADDFLNSTYDKQRQKDEAKREKMEQRHRKLIQQHHLQNNNINAVHNHHQSPVDVSGGPPPLNQNNGHNPPPAHSTSCTSENPSTASSASSFEQFGIGGGGFNSVSTSDLPAFSSANGGGSDGGSPSAIPNELRDDPRLHDEHLKKFFFRQRVDSRSRHPGVHYHCPLQPIDLNVCARYQCNGASIGGIHRSAQDENSSSSSGSVGRCVECGKNTAVVERSHSGSSSSESGKYRTLTDRPLPHATSSASLSGRQRIGTLTQPVAASATPPPPLRDFDSDDLAVNMNAEEEASSFQSFDFFRPPPTNPCGPPANINLASTSITEFERRSLSSSIAGDAASFLSGSGAVGRHHHHRHHPRRAHVSLCGDCGASTLTDDGGCFLRM